MSGPHSGNTATHRRVSPCCLDEAYRWLNERRAAAPATQDRSPFRDVVDELTDGCGCACHTGTGYNTTCGHCRPATQDRDGLREALEPYIITEGSFDHEDAKPFPVVLRRDGHKLTPVGEPEAKLVRLLADQARSEAASPEGGLDVERAAWLAGWIASASQMTTWTEEAIQAEAERQYARLWFAARLAATDDRISVPDFGDTPSYYVAAPDDREGTDG